MLKDNNNILENENEHLKEHIKSLNKKNAELQNELDITKSEFNETKEYFENGDKKFPTIVDISDMPLSSSLI